MILAAKSKGQMRIFQAMYESQLYFLEDLNKMKAQIILTSPNMAISFGPSNFKGAKVNASEVLQCAHAELLAGLAAQGVTTIENADIISRRYPEIVETLTRLGAKISLVR
jgi:UDP-N-acetylglucosamine 1-carboxyvinyltransferase